MRKSSIFIGLVLVSVILAYGNAYAAGECSSCHTMHNMQGGSVVDAAGPNQQLLNNSCVACHTAATTKTNLTTNAPAVLHTTDPGTQGNGKTNAGGDFYWVATGYGATDAKGHNVLGVAAADGTIGVAPPGFDQAATTGLSFDSRTLEVTGGAGWTGKQLTCSGTFGCHGARDQEGFGGLSGAHHGNTGGTATQASSPSKIGDSFRFLAGIKGLENADWNWGENATTHNEYYGVNATVDRQYDSGSTYADKTTISFFCAECHGDFHTDVANDSAYASGDPWRRHPTDLMLPSSGEYNNYNPDALPATSGAAAGDYNIDVPVARPTVPGSSSASVTPGTDAIIMCLTCHRAHGSPEPDLLRFTYDMQAGTGTTDSGCFVCHTGKNAD